MFNEREFIRYLNSLRAGDSVYVHSRRYIYQAHVVSSDEETFTVKTENGLLKFNRSKGRPVHMMSWPPKVMYPTASVQKNSQYHSKRRISRDEAIRHFKLEENTLFTVLSDINITRDDAREFMQDEYEFLFDMVVSTDASEEIDRLGERYIRSIISHVNETNMSQKDLFMILNCSYKEIHEFLCSDNNYILEYVLNKLRSSVSENSYKSKLQGFDTSQVINKRFFDA